jgi:tRNA threonylcarbamoyladenosine biosynthesis protein TsaB
MKVLAMHTTGIDATVALVEIESREVESEDSPEFESERVRTLGQRKLTRRSGAAELVPAIHELLEAAGWAAGDVEAIALAVGPGSFTGIRTGLATAKGWATAMGTPIFMVSSLAVMASAIERGTAILDAGRGEFYAGRYADRGREKVSEELIRADQWMQTLDGGDPVVVCEESVARALGATGREFIEVPAGDAEGVARVAAVRVLRGDWSDWELAEGNYLRRPDAQVKLEQSAGKD